MHLSLKFNSRNYPLFLTPPKPLMTLKLCSNELAGVVVVEIGDGGRFIAKINAIGKAFSFPIQKIIKFSIL